MSYKIFRKSEQETKPWAGGTTTQLYIYPKESTYQEFNFDVRISTATVEVEESTFTFMPGVTRHLLILNGSLQINHTDRYKKELNTFDQDVFNGEWPTTAKGKVKDFNLMLRNNHQGRIFVLFLEKDETKPLTINQNNRLFAVYIEHGVISLQLNEKLIELSANDFIHFESPFCEIQLICTRKSALIFVEISK